MKKNVLLIVFLELSIFALAQNEGVAFNGVVLFQNSQRTPAIGVEIRGLGATHDYTTSAGSFRLKYVDKIAGDPAGLDIGPQDKYNTPIELVNAEVVHNTNIPRSSNEKFYVVVCKAGQLAEAKSYYYGLSVAKLKEKYEKQIQLKQQQLEEAIINNQHFLGIRHELDSLKNRYKNALDRAENLAEYIASVNKDFASDMVNQAIWKLKEDQDIEGALEVINEKKLDDQYQLNMKKKKDADSSIQKVIEGYNFKIKLYLTEFKYDDAIRCYKKIVGMYEENNLNIFDYKFMLLGFAHVYKDIGDYPKGLEVQKKILTTINLYTTESIAEIQLYVGALSAIGTTYADLGIRDSAFYYLNTALASNESIKDRREPELVSMYNTIRMSVYGGLCIAYRNEDMPAKAAEYARKLIDVAKNKLDMTGAALAGLYNAAATTYLVIGRYDSVVTLETQAIALLSDSASPNLNDLAQSYKNLAISELFLPALRNRSTDHIQKACMLSEKVLQPLDADLAECYYWAGLLYEKDDLTDSSIYYYELGANIYNKIGRQKGYRNCHVGMLRIFGNRKFDSKDYLEAISYLDSAYQIDSNIVYLHTIGLSYNYLNNHKKAIYYFEKVLQIDNEKKEPYIYNDIGLAFASDGQLDNAAKAFRHFEAQHIDAARSYRNWAAYYGFKLDREAALKNLRLAVQNGYKDLEWITTDSSLSCIRSDERYRKIVTELSESLKTK